MREMKDSGIEWIGEIPEDSKISKLKFVAKDFYSGGTPSATNNIFYSDSDEYPFVNISDISNVGHLERTVKHLTKLGIKDKNLQLVPKNSILYGMYASVGIVSENIIPVYISQAIISFKANENFNQGFLKYWLNVVKENLSIYYRGTTQNNLNAEVIKNLPVLIYRPLIQTQIANYLDDKCSKIEDIIAKAQLSIEKLKEYKQAIITEAVTKGLDPDVELKGSGVEWIGEIPKDWDIKKIKYVSKIMRGKFAHRPRNDPDYYDGKYPFIQTGDVSKSNKYIYGYTQTLNELGFNVSMQFPKGSICMTIAANIGDVAILDFDACFPDSIVGFKPYENINRDYLYYFFVVMKNRLHSVSIISTQMNINVDIIKEEFISIPSNIEEQKAIAGYLDKKCSAIDESIAKKERIIERLSEYKKSLIYEVVTGKREV